jgi:hypothetical protein
VLRATAAAFGVAGVLAIGWLGRRFGTWTGIVAAAWAAGSLWLVCVSRDGMRNTIVPFFGAVALIALLHWAARPGRALGAPGRARSPRWRRSTRTSRSSCCRCSSWSGCCGCAAPTARITTSCAPGFVPFAAAFLVVAAPMIAVAVTEPATTSGGRRRSSAFNPAVEADSNPPIHILRTIGMFGLAGDPNPRHDVAALPLCRCHSAWSRALGWCGCGGCAATRATP